MAEITATMIKDLRERTGSGMADCKKALVETAGDMEKATEYLRKKGLASAAKKEGRVATEGLVQAYIHAGGRIGVLVEVNCETDFVAKTEDFQKLVRDVAMHVAGTPYPPLYVTKEEVPAAVLEKEKEIYREQARAAGKPPQVVDKIAEGKLKDYYSSFCLLEQPYIRDDKMTVGQLIQEKIALIKENIVVRRFARFRVGEEIAGQAPSGD